MNNLTSKNKDEIRIPDFIIVGAAKCGTTSIAQYLKQHSQVFLPRVKEGRFFSGVEPNCTGPGDFAFNISIPKDINEYSNNFIKAKKGQLICDASVDYLFFYENTIENLKKYYSQDELPKLIISLRNPAKRTFSMYSHLKRDLRETLSLPEAIAAEDQRRKNNWEWVWQYTAVSKYYEQVKYYLENYDTAKIKIVIYEEFIQDPTKYIYDILEFLGLEKEHINTNIAFNPSGQPKSKLFQKIVISRAPLAMFFKRIFPKRMKEKLRQSNIRKVSMKKSEYDLLKPIFMEDIGKLEKLLKKDLSAWK